jgi:hypothetical protein
VHRGSNHGPGPAGGFAQLVSDLGGFFLDGLRSYGHLVLDGLAVPDASGTGLELVVSSAAGTGTEDVSNGYTYTQKKLVFHDELLLCERVARRLSVPGGPGARCRRK